MTYDRAAFLEFNRGVDRARADYYAATQPITHCDAHRRKLDSRGRCPICSARASSDYRARKAA